MMRICSVSHFLGYYDDDTHNDHVDNDVDDDVNDDDDDEDGGE